MTFCTSVKSNKSKTGRSLLAITTIATLSLTHSMASANPIAVQSPQPQQPASILAVALAQILNNIQRPTLNFGGEFTYQLRNGSSQPTSEFSLDRVHLELSVPFGPSALIQVPLASATGNKQIDAVLPMVTIGLQSSTLRISSKEDESNKVINTTVDFIDGRGQEMHIPVIVVSQKIAIQTIHLTSAKFAISGAQPDASTVTLKGSCDVDQDVVNAARSVTAESVDCEYTAKYVKASGDIDADVIYNPSK